MFYFFILAILWDVPPSLQRFIYFQKLVFPKLILISVIHMDLIKKLMAKQDRLESYYLWMALFMVAVFLLAFGVYRLPELL